MITTPEEAEGQLVARAYDVVDLVCDPARPADGPDFDSLINLIISAVRPTSWSEVGGPGEAQALGAAGINALVLSQTSEVHQTLFNCLRVFALYGTAVRNQGAPAAAARPGGEQDFKAGRVKGLTPAQERISQALGKQIKLTFANASLKEVAADLQQRTGVHFAVDEKAIRESLAASEQTGPLSQEKTGP